MEDFAAIRLCEREGCEWKVHNSLVEPKDILQSMTNHLLAAHPAGAGGVMEEEERPRAQQQFRLWTKNALRFSTQRG